MLSTKLAELRKSRKSNQSGFTIIEVMIVLAIAALILLIVLLAVPALQRNSRNTQRKNDVAHALTAINEHARNGGALSSLCIGADTGGCTFLEGVSFSSFDPQRTSNKIIFTNNTVIATALITAASNPAQNDTLYLFQGMKCGANSSDAPVAGPKKGLVAYFTVETSGDGKKQCAEG